VISTAAFRLFRASHSALLPAWGIPLTLSGAVPHEPVALALMCVIGIGNAFVDIGVHAARPARAGGAASAIAHRDEEIGALNCVAMFRPLPMPATDELALHLDRLDYAAGEEVVVQGEHGDRFYVIEDGEADVIGDGPLIRTLRSRDGFGEIALLHDLPRTTTVRARTPLRLYALDRHHFLSAVNGYESSEREADALALDRLEAFNPAH